MSRHYIAPCSRPDGCRVAHIGFRRGNVSQLTVMHADCGWSTEIPQGAEHHLTDALARWQEHVCLPKEAAG